MKLIIAIIQPTKLEAVKEALTKVEVFRLTVMDVQGFGRQKGYTEVYRGHELTVNLLRKIAAPDRRQRGLRRADRQRHHPGRPDRPGGQDRRRQDLHPAAGRLHPHPHRRARARGDLNEGDGRDEHGSERITTDQTAEINLVLIRGNPFRSVFIPTILKGRPCSRTTTSSATASAATSAASAPPRRWRQGRSARRRPHAAGRRAGAGPPPRRQALARWLPNTTVGELVRPSTPEDERQAHAHARRAGEVMTRAERLINELALPLALLDVEILFDGKNAVLHLVRWQECDVRDLVRPLSSEFDLVIVLADLAAAGRRSRRRSRLRLLRQRRGVRGLLLRRRLRLLRQRAGRGHEGSLRRAAASPWNGACHSCEPAPRGVG